MANGLIIGDDVRVISWVNKAFSLFPMDINLALGIIKPDGTLVGAILFRNFNGINVELSYYGPKTVTLGISRAIARTALTEFNAARVTVITSKRNKSLIAGIQKIGFRLEGAQRCYYGHKDCQRNTGIRLVMFRTQIEALAGMKPVEQKVG